MRAIFFAALSTVFALLLLPWASALRSEPRFPYILDQDLDNPYIKFALPCPADTSCGAADEALVFGIQIKPSGRSTPSKLLINHSPVDFDENTQSSPFSVALDVNSTGNSTHHVTILGQSHSLNQENPSHFLDSFWRDLAFNITTLDGIVTSGLGFELNTQSVQHAPSLSLVLASGHLPQLKLNLAGRPLGSTANHTQPTSDSRVIQGQDKEDEMKGLSEDASFDLATEIEALHLLEEEAENLHDEIVIKKQAISNHLRHHRNHSSLQQLLSECDGLMCVARVVAQRICDKVGKVGLLTEHNRGYFQVQSANLHNTIMHSSEPITSQQTSRNNTKSVKFAEGLDGMSEKSNSTAKPFSIPFTMTKNGTGHEYHFKDFVNPPNPLVRAMQIIVSVLGLAVLCSYIRNKCMSMRKRVERAADREERRNARAYRRAARRAKIRRRWDSFVRAINCFRPAVEPKMEDYEEKRALILQDAFLEQVEDLDQAEKGEVMEAEIRELRHAHEIVASLVRVDENRYDLETPPTSDPPPSRVPLPYTVDSRSRASTNTLPSYNCESLPDYSSRPDTSPERGSQRSTAISSTRTPATSTEGSRHSVPSISSAGRTRYTPTSSVLEISPRVSEETLRTRQSKDTQDF
ncbi:hypothetical protein D0862_05074 [Hortaea werneckii]|uniref:Uncharacterized protein n=1 Tax=Hortaea werneckii TaxID=91943 RepID=A0A3M7GVV1_HORWE|nr:hypothetical protein KC320_g7603 [Hortaea werneckii]RMZ05159.1 hypothetical protein D0862_05074 [Hortaea werneckii]